MQLHIVPAEPKTWIRYGLEMDTSSTKVTMNMKCPVDREIHLRWIEETLTKELWATVSAHEANGGLGEGEPDLAPTKKLHQRMLADGQVRQARALEAAVTHNIWWAARATDDVQRQLCVRCDKFPETLFHRLYTCENTTQDLDQKAVDGHPSNSAFWLGCIHTAQMHAPKGGDAFMSECGPNITGDFLELFRRTGRCGVDGSGGELFRHPRLRGVGVGRSVICFGHRFG